MQNPTRATYKGHGKPETFWFFGLCLEVEDRRLPRIVRFEKRYTAYEFIDVETGEVLASCGAAGKFWAAPVEAEETTEVTEDEDEDEIEDGPGRCGCDRDPEGHTIDEHHDETERRARQRDSQNYHQELAEEVRQNRSEEPEPDPVATQPVPPAEDTEPAGSSIVKALERVWDQIRANHSELPTVVIVTGSGMVGPPRWGHFRANGWTERTEKGAALDLAIGEMFVAGETLARGADHTVETMLHEAAHVLARVREIKDTSRQGRWHNQKFRMLAEELGLEYPKESAHPQVGYSECVMTPGAREEYAEVIEELDKAIRLTIALPEFLATAPEGEEGHGAGEHIHGGRKPRQPGTGSATNNLKAVCGCPTPRIIRASRKVLEEGDIVCGKCREPFEPSDEDR